MKSIENDNSNSLLVLLSLTLSVLSLISSVALFISRAMKIAVTDNKNVRQKTRYEVKFKLQCSKLKPCHAFVNEMMRHEIIKVIRNSKDGNLWNDRQDTYLDIDVFFIENDVKINHEITVYFSLTVSCYGDKHRASRVTTKLRNTIQEFGEKGTDIQKLLQKAFHAQMKLEQVSPFALKIYDLKTILNETDLGKSSRNVNINKSIHGRKMAGSIAQSQSQSQSQSHSRSQSQNATASGNQSIDIDEACYHYDKQLQDDDDDDEKRSEMHVSPGNVQNGFIMVRNYSDESNKDAINVNCNDNDHDNDEGNKKVVAVSAPQAFAQIELPDQPIQPPLSGETNVSTAVGESIDKADTFLSMTDQAEGVITPGTTQGGFEGNRSVQV